MKLKNLKSLTKSCSGGQICIHLLWRIEVIHQKLAWLGRLSRCVYTASLASVLFSLSIGVELLILSFSQYFLLLASVSNIAKQMWVFKDFACELVFFLIMKARRRLLKFNSHFVYSFS
ncbi:hypothetical protein GIB67_021657 [Kingdonia uniflora]|uniref:Uncharacterized protein n=1 Tax=Kingdonia uniflora TaxID=39325 RepID=A0A7J7KY35_9MAGN|nr:hypothetical protein GIB67_021657 [Kingdonia uniflora]